MHRRTLLTTTTAEPCLTLAQVDFQGWHIPVVLTCCARNVSIPALTSRNASIVVWFLSIKGMRVNERPVKPSDVDLGYFGTVRFQLPFLG